MELVLLAMNSLITSVISSELFVGFSAGSAGAIKDTTRAIESNEIFADMAIFYLHPYRCFSLPAMLSHEQHEFYKKSG